MLNSFNIFLYHNPFSSNQVLFCSIQTRNKLVSPFIAVFEHFIRIGATTCEVVVVDWLNVFQRGVVILSVIL